MPINPSFISLEDLDGTNGFRVDGIDVGDHMGGAVSSAGDVNGDGFDDIIVGAVYGDPGGNSNAGESYVIFGNGSGFTAALDLSTLDGTNGFRLDGIDVGDYSGRSVSSAGDVNGDGFDDIIIGAEGGDPGGDNGAGESYVVFGQASGFAAALDLSTLNGSSGFRIDGIDVNDFSGRAVCSAGDVNGDGFDDILIGAFRGDSGGVTYVGESYVVFGKASGFGAALDLSSLDGGNGLRIDGIGNGDYTGWSVSTAGDVNGDGFDDIVIGAFRSDPGGDDSAGASYVVFGKASGFAVALDLATLNGNNGFRIDGIDPFDNSGRSVSSVGDMNGDGFDDLVIGAPYGDPGGDLSAGESYVVFGKASGFAAALDLTILNGRNGFRIDGIDTRDYSGSSVSSGGDVNGDGFDDILIGARGGDPGGDVGAGESYIVFGKARGFTGALDLSNLDGSNGFRIDGIDSLDRSGQPVSAAGDVNGDGFDDILIGALGGDASGDEYAGESYVLFGFRSLESVTITGTRLGLTHNGGFGDDVIKAIGGDDFIFGWEGDDLIASGAGNDTADGGDGSDEIQGGSGNDHLRGGRARDDLFGGTGRDTLLGDGGTDALNGGRGRDVLTGGTLSDRFKFAAGDSGQTAATMDRIRDFTKGAVGVGDRFDFSSALTIGGSANAVTANEASINQATGVASFAAGSGTTLADALNDIANRFTLSGNSVGEFALFRVNNTGNFHVFVSDGVAGVNANDLLVQLTLTTIGSIDLTGGDLTILS